MYNETINNLVNEYECDYKDWYEKKMKKNKKPIKKEEYDNELIDHFESEVD